MSTVLEANPTVFCGVCANPCELMQVRVKSKGEGTWQCLKCMTRITQLRREYDVWPTPTFNSLSEDEQKEFFSMIGQATDWKAAVKMFDPY